MISNTGLIVNEKARETVRGGVALSCTTTLKVVVAAVVGVPEISPAADKVSPGGSVLSAAKDHERVPVPPDALNCNE